MKSRNSTASSCTKNINTFLIVRPGRCSYWADVYQNYIVWNRFSTGPHARFHLRPLNTFADIACGPTRSLNHVCRSVFYLNATEPLSTAVTYQTSMNTIFESRRTSVLLTNTFHVFLRPNSTCIQNNIEGPASMHQNMRVYGVRVFKSS
jgi:hypothetical protein